MQKRVVEILGLRIAVLALGFIISTPMTAAIAAPPTLSKAFGSSSIVLGGTTSLTFNLSNPNAGVTLTGLAFTDTMPAGLVVATPNGLTGSCGGGVITATAGSSTVSLSGATLAPLTSCTFSVNVTATSFGSKINTTSTVTSNQSGAGAAATAAVGDGAIVPMLDIRGLLALGLVLAAIGALRLRKV